jgi:hypothetical protein
MRGLVRSYVTLAITVVYFQKESHRREPSAWGFNWVTLSLGDINTETWSSRLGVERKGDDLDLKNITVTKSKEVKTG